MNKEKQKILPELRFPEFENDEGWIDSTIEEISLISSGGTPSRAKPEYWNGDIPWISTTLINYNKIKIANEFITELGLNNSSTKMFPKGTILMAMYGQGKTRGKVAVLDIEAAINQACAAISLKKDMNIEFVFQNLSARYEEIRKISNEGGQKNLSSTLIKKIPFLHPKIGSEEQQKIANCLSSLDILITAETEKLVYLKDHKKGLLQQLFPTKGETKPQFRFPEFMGDGDWEEKKIDKVCEKPFSGGTPTSTNMDYYGGNIPFIRSAEINKEKTKLFLTQLGLKNSSAKMVKEGDVLVALYGANSGDVGISKINGAINQAVLCLRSKGSNSFLHQYLSHKKDWIITKYLQGGQGNLSGDIIKSVELFFPTDIKEQQKIANCLSSVDDLIQAQTTKIEALKAHKKGLMQQLFPLSEP